MHSILMIRYAKLTLILGSLSSGKFHLIDLGLFLTTTSEVITQQASYSHTRLMRRRDISQFTQTKLCGEHLQVSYCHMMKSTNSYSTRHFVNVSNFLA